MVPFLVCIYSIFDDLSNDPKTALKLVEIWLGQILVTLFVSFCESCSSLAVPRTAGIEPGPPASGLGVRVPAHWANLVLEAGAGKEK